LSQRSELAREIAAFVADNGLAQVYGGDSEAKGRYYSILFSKCRTLDGVIHFYGPKFILVKYQTAFRDLPRNDSRVFTSIKNALDFLRLAFVELDFEAALTIPVKESK
jgi:hypothetical protein